jgi:hypothetical protein
LDPLGRELIARLAMIANAVDWQVLYTLNPERPAWPEHVNRPTLPEFRTDSRLDRLWQQHTAAKRPKDRTGPEQQIHDLEHELTEHYEAEQRAFTQFQREHAAWEKADAAASRRLNDILSDLEIRGLLQCDRRARKFDLHPVVRGYVIQSLAADARAETGQRVADYFFSRTRGRFEDATSPADLQNAIQIVQALALAGKTEAAWAVLNGAMSRALYRLELHHERLALMHAFFPLGWSSPPAGVDDVALVASVAVASTSTVGLVREAIFQTALSIRGEARRSLSVELGIRLRNMAHRLSRREKLASAERLLHLSRRVAEAAGYSKEVLWCDLREVAGQSPRGRLTDALTSWKAIKTRLGRTAAMDKQLEAEALLTEGTLLYRANTLPNDYVAQAIARAHELGERFFERRLWSLFGRWRQSNRNDYEAADALADAIEMAHAVGLRDAESGARRSLSLTRSGQRPAAEDAAAAEWDPPHDALAELYLELGERDKARRHALEGYKQYWENGPPYSFHWELQSCRAVPERGGRAEAAAAAVRPRQDRAVPLRSRNPPSAGGTRGEGQVDPPFPPRKNGEGRTADLSEALKRVQKRYAGSHDVGRVSGNERQTMHFCGCGEPSVDDRQRVGDGQARPRPRRSARRSTARDLRAA